MVVALLIMLTGISLSGIALRIDGYRNAEWIEEVHEWLVNGILALIGLHILGVILASLEHRENLIMSLFTGRKRVP